MGKFVENNKNNVYLKFENQIKEKNSIKLG